MKSRLVASALIGLIFASASALAVAAENCPRIAPEQWKPEADVRAVTESMGYKVVQIKMDDGCYEVLATDKKGKKFELQFNPADAKLLSRYPAKSERAVASR